MKKILIIIVLLFPLSVFAIENVTYKDHNYYLCDENGTAYHLYEIKYNTVPMFLLNYGGKLNFDFNNYEQVKYEDSPYLSNVQDYLWITPLVNHISVYKYYYQIITRYLWENIYPEKIFYFCNESTLGLEAKEEVYQTVKKRVQNVVNGPEILKETHYQDSEDEYTYQDETFKFYYLFNTDGLDASLVGDTLKVKGKSGDYKLTFKIKNNMSSKYNELYTDGNNYLALYPKQPDNEYFMNIVINKITLNISFENTLLDENLCLDVYQDNTFLKKSCLNDQIISLNLDKGIYIIKLLNNDYYEDYEEEIDLNKEEEILLNLQTRDINNNNVNDSNEDEVKDNINIENIKETKQDDVLYINTEKNNNDVLTFKPKNTYKGMNLIFIFIIFSYYVIYQKK